MSAVAARLAGVRLRVAWVVVPAVGLLVALPFVGRWEEHRNAASQNARMAAVFRLATSDGLISSRLDGYRLDWTIDCLVYRDPADPRSTSALELCFDAHGRLVETIDRRTGSPRFASLQEQPSLATTVVPVSRILHVLAVGRAFALDPRLAGFDWHGDVLPMHNNDNGIYRFPVRFR